MPLIDMSNKTVIISTAIGATLVAGLGFYYLKTRKDQQKKNEKKVQKIVSYFEIFKAFFILNYSNL